MAPAGGLNPSAWGPPQGRSAASLPFGQSFMTSVGPDSDKGRGWTFWGRGMATRFDSQEDGLAVHGEVTTYMAGADTALGRWRTGLAIARSGGAAFSDPARGIRVDVKARGLVAHQDIEYREWGASVAIRFDPGTARRGLMLALTPSWGRAASSAPGLWTQRGLRESGGLGYQDPAGHLGAELSYAADGPQGRGTQTPYAALTLENARSRTLRIGWRWTVSLNGNLYIEGTRQNTVKGMNAEYGASLRAAMRW